MNRCEVPRCRGEVSLIYLDHGICDHHWNQLADDESRAQLRMVLGLDATAAMEEEAMPENPIPAAEDAATTEEAMPAKKTEKSKKARAKKVAKPAASKKATKPAKQPKPKKEKRAPDGPVPNRVFAIRVTDDELAAIHQAAGPRNATRFIRTVAAAFANEDEAAFKAVLKEARELRG